MAEVRLVRMQVKLSRIDSSTIDMIGGSNCGDINKVELTINKNWSEMTDDS
jgi:hypothetical protein